MCGCVCVCVCVCVFLQGRSPEHGSGQGCLTVWSPEAKHPWSIAPICCSIVAMLWLVLSDAPVKVAFEFNYSGLALAARVTVQP